MASAAAGSQHRCVFVGNIPYDATEEQLIQICEEVGPVVSFRLVLDRETGKPKGYGFCEYKDEETALSARRNLQGYEINGRQLRVDFAENDKGADRNREQGRGGPGLLSQADPQKSAGGNSFTGDLSLHQPIGLPVAASAASTMAGALGEGQLASGSSIQNGFPSHLGLGGDPLTHYLAKMSRHQLNEVISEMKALATRDKALAQQLLQGSPQLSKALFQAQIMIGLVSPQMLQMAKAKQASSSVQKSAFQDGMQGQQPILQPHLINAPRLKDLTAGALIGTTQISSLNATQNPPILQQSARPLQQAPFQPQVSQFTQMPLIGTLQPARPQPIGNLSVQSLLPPPHTSNFQIPQMQAPFLQNPRPVGTAPSVRHPSMAVPNAALLHPPVPGLSNLQTLQMEASTSCSTSIDPTWNSGLNMRTSANVGLDKASAASFAPELLGRPPKLAKMENAGAVPFAMNSRTSQMTIKSGSQQQDEQIPQFPPEIESALWQQVMSLTPEQLTSLPNEQQEQVLQLQKALQLRMMPSNRNNS